jgi:hypothetical protein
MISTLTNAIRSLVSYILAPSNLALRLATGSKDSEPSAALKVVLSRLTLLVCLLLLIFVDVDETTKDMLTDVIRSELHTGQEVIDTRTPVRTDSVPEADDFN